jgi:Family of unknown function (DUF6152)
MKRALTLSVLVLAMAAVAPSVAAHHAVNAVYDVSKTVQMKGKLKKIDWINPHAWFHFDVADASGKVTTWALESPGPVVLRRIGLSDKSLWKVGETYTFTTSPAHNGKPVGIFGSVTFPDGKVINIAAVDPAQQKKTTP